MLKEYYDRNPARSKPLVPGVERFIRPTLPDRSEVNSIMKGSRRARENKENRPEKLPRTEEPPKKKEEPVNDVCLTSSFYNSTFVCSRIVRRRALLRHLTPFTL